MLAALCGDLYITLITSLVTSAMSYCTLAGPCIDFLSKDSTHPPLDLKVKALTNNMMQLNLSFLVIPKLSCDDMGPLIRTIHLLRTL